MISGHSWSIEMISGHSGLYDWHHVTDWYSIERILDEIVLVV
jgi:hypothetical protein